MRACSLSFCDCPCNDLFLDRDGSVTRGELRPPRVGRARNGGLSSAYDSVFRVAESELSAEELDRRSRVRVGKKGNARTISKKEAAREAAFEATLRLKYESAQAELAAAAAGKHDLAC